MLFAACYCLIYILPDVSLAFHKVRMFGTEPALDLFNFLPKCTSELLQIFRSKTIYQIFIETWWTGITHFKEQLIKHSSRLKSQSFKTCFYSCQDSSSVEEGPCRYRL